MKKFLLILCCGATSACAHLEELLMTPENKCENLQTQFTVGADIDSLIHVVKTSSVPYRIVPPNTAVTADYLAERLTVYIDDNKKIIRAHCG